MPTCKDCVHVEVCRDFVLSTISDEKEKQAAEKKLSALENKMNIDECNFFKDRSKFIELPCNVGDTVYMITGRTEKVRRKKILKHIIVECGVDNFRIGDLGYPSAALCDKDNNWWYGIEPSDFGNLVFLTREEAEQALKEREKE